MKEKILRIQGLSIPYFCDRTDVVGRSRVVLLEDFIVPPNSEFIAPAMIESPNFQKGSAIIEPLDKFMEKQDVLVSKSLVNAVNGIVPVKYLNLKDESLHLHKGNVVATVEKVEGIDETSAGLVTCNQIST